TEPTRTTRSRRWSARTRGLTTTTSPTRPTSWPECRRGSRYAAALQHRPGRAENPRGQRGSAHGTDAQGHGDVRSGCSHHRGVRRLPRVPGLEGPPGGRTVAGHARQGRELADG